MLDVPGRDIAALLHEGAQCEPEAVLHREMIGQPLSATVRGGHGRRLLGAPFGRSEATGPQQKNKHKKREQRSPSEVSRLFSVYVFVPFFRFPFAFKGMGVGRRRGVKFSPPYHCLEHWQWR